MKQRRAARKSKGFSLLVPLHFFRFPNPPPFVVINSGELSLRRAKKMYNTSHLLIISSKFILGYLSTAQVEGREREREKTVEINPKLFSRSCVVSPR